MEKEKGLGVDAPEPLKPLPPELWDHILKNSHASAAIAGAARIDDRLSSLIASRFPNLSNTLREKLFTGYGPIASFSVRIDVAFAFGIIDAELKSDLDAIRQIRNAFAHSSEALGLLSPEPLKWLQCLKGYKAVRDPLDFLLAKFSEVQEKLDPVTWALARALLAPSEKRPAESTEPSPLHSPPDPDDTGTDAGGPPRSSRG